MVETDDSLKREHRRSSYLLHDIGQMVAFEEKFRTAFGDASYEQHLRTMKEVVLERDAAGEEITPYRCLNCRGVVPKEN